MPSPQEERGFLIGGDSTSSKSVSHYLDNDNISPFPPLAYSFDSPKTILKSEITSDDAEDTRYPTTDILSLHLTPSDGLLSARHISEISPLIDIIIIPDITDTDTDISIFMNLDGKKKYKPVARKIKPFIGELPGKFRIIRNIIGDPLEHLPSLPTRPPPFSPKGRYTQECKELFDKLNPGFLLPAECELMHYFMRVHKDGFAWETAERGHFREDFFPPINIPVIPHTPWVQRNIWIPPGLYKEICRIVKDKIDAGVFEPSNSSYRSRWFVVVKKDGKSLRIVQSLEPLNQVTITHSGVPPFTEQLAEQFAGRACCSMMDLYVGYDE